MNNFREALELISTGKPQDVYQGMNNVSDLLQRINNTTLSVNEAVEKINSGQSTSSGTGSNSIFEFSIGF